MTLLRVYLQTTWKEANDILILWTKAQGEEQKLEEIPFRDMQEAQVVADYLKLHSGIPYSQSTAYVDAQYQCPLPVN